MFEPPFYHLTSLNFSFKVIGVKRFQRKEGKVVRSQIFENDWPKMVPKMTLKTILTIFLKTRGYEMKKSTFWEDS